MAKPRIYSRSAHAYIFCTAMNSIVDLFIITFFTAYMLSISGYDIGFMAKFYIMVYVCIGIFYFALTPLVKKINQVHFVRIGAILKGAFILLVVFLGDSIQEHYIWLGLLYGVIESIFWSGNNMFKNNVVESQKLKGLNSITGINTQIVGIVFPILFGVSIDAVSFTKIAVLVFIVSVAQIISTLFLESLSKPKEQTSVREFAKAVKNSQSRGLITMMYALMLFRGFQYFMPTYLTYLIVVVLHTNTSLGILTTIAALVSILVLVLFNVIKKADTNIWLYLLFTVAQCACILLCNIWMAVALIVAFQVVYTICKTTLDALTEAVRGSIILDAGLQRFMPESLAIGEVFLNLGRVLGYVAVLILGLSQSAISSAIVTGLFILFIILFTMTVGIIKIKIKKQAISTNLEQQSLDKNS